MFGLKCDRCGARRFFRIITVSEIPKYDKCRIKKYGLICIDCIKIYTAELAQLYHFDNLKDINIEK